MKRSRKGSALLSVILILAVFLFLGAITARIVYNCYAAANAVLVREQAFHLAEAGLEKGKVELTHNPNWHTDLPYYTEDSVDWLMNYAVGQETTLGEGVFKLVRERDKNRLYSIGSKGKGIVMLKLRFTTNPFQGLEWEEI